MMKMATANAMTPMKAFRISRSSGSLTATFLTTGGGSRRILDTRGGAAMLTDCFPDLSGLAMAATIAASGYHAVSALMRIVCRSALYRSETNICEALPMNMKHLLLGALALGGTAGYMWSAVAPGARLASGKELASLDKGRKSPALIEVPQTVEQDAADQAWSSGDAQPVLSSHASSAQTAAVNVFYPGCSAVRAAGKAPLYSDQPGYRIEMDGDGDGVACEPHVGR